MNEPIEHDVDDATPPQETPEPPSEFARMLAESPTAPAEGPQPRPGDRVRGRIVHMSAEEAFVDFGGRSEGVLSLSEMRDEEGRPKHAVGDTIEAVVASADGPVTLSLALRPEKANLEALGQAHQSGLPVEGQVKAINSGGFEVKVGGVRAFCPFSQMDLLPVGDGSAWLHKTLQFKVLEMGEGGRKVVLSRRALLQEERGQRASEVRAQLAVGQELEGTVVRVAPFGAFVDLGGLEGLVHVSELSRSRVENPADAVHPGQHVRVKVLRLAHMGEPNERISLSMKALEADPWSSLAGKLQEGDVVQGRVARLADFGAFVEVLPGLDGLVHVSQISRRRVAHPRDVLQEGQEVAVKVLKIDPAAKRLSLSVREAESAALPQGPPPSAGQILDGVVAGIKPYGVFVDLPSGATGLLPRAETDVPRGADLSKFFHVGDTVRVGVLEVAEDGKIRLSTKAAQSRDEADNAQRYLKPEMMAEPGHAPTGAFAEAMRRAEEDRRRGGRQS